MSGANTSTFAGAPTVALDDPVAGTSVPTNTPTVLKATTRYARATDIEVTGRVAPGERVTLTATAGNAWTVVRGADGRPRGKPGKPVPATPADLRRLRWRVHCGGVLLVDQRPGEQGGAVTLTLPTHMPGETLVAGAYHHQPTVNSFTHWWVEDSGAPEGRRAGTAGVLEDPTQLAEIMGYSVGPGRNIPAVVEALFPHLVRLFPEYGMTGTLQQAHFLAQVRHETLGLRYLREQISDAQAARDYGVKNGNRGPADGAAFKGRGLLQTTGYDGYDAYFDNARQQHLARPELRRQAPDLERFPDAAEAGLYFYLRNAKRVLGLRR